MDADRSLLVIGGGPAGITAALQACELGAQVTLLEAAQIGGTSLNRGPAPVRTLARAARLARDWSSWATFGLLGPVSFTGPHTVAAGDGRTWSADCVVLAVGGHAGRLPIPGADLALTYEDIPSLTALPGRAAVVGGADTGCQIASILEDLGVTVSLFEAAPTLLPAADPSVSVGLGDAFLAQGMN